MNENRINVLIKAWETFQNLSKGFGENSWKIRTLGIGFWVAIISYGYKNNIVTMYYLSILVIVMFFILEAGMRQFQQKFINKSVEIEKSINDYLVGDDIRLPNEGITTNTSIPTIMDYIKLLHHKRWMFWLPYLSLIVASILLITLTDC